MLKLIHYDKSPNWVPKPVVIGEQPNLYKPGGGIWCAVPGCKYPYEKWLKDNGYPDPMIERYAYVIDFNDENVDKGFLLIDNVDQLGFLGIFGYFKAAFTIDWNKIAKDYPGVFYEHQQNDVLMRNIMRGWDYDQAVIFDTAMIANVKRIN